MSKRLKLASAIVLAGVLILPGEALAKPRPRTFKFAGGTNITSLNVTCAPGATSGSASALLMVKATRRYGAVTANYLGDSLGRSTRIVAQFPGGSITIGRFEQFYRFPRNYKFPCPVHTNPASSTFTISLQPFRGRTAIGTAAKVDVRLNRVGSAS
jgi:hypothetical protein